MYEEYMVWYFWNNKFISHVFDEIISDCYDGMKWNGMDIKTTKSFI